MSAPDSPQPQALGLPSEPPAGKSLAADDYAERHDLHADFEDVCLLARQQQNLRVLADLRPRRVLEVGCGPQLLSVQAWAQGLPIERWVAVEPAERYVQAAREASARHPGLFAVHGYIEQAAPALASLLPEGARADLVVVSGVIHETSEPEALLAAALAWLRPGGHLLVSVPNAQSFHRLLAVQMGLMERPELLSERNRLLGQPRVFGPQDLRDLVAGMGLEEDRLDGYLFKPFTHAQMASLVPQLGAPGVQGLIDLGRQFPLQAAEICLVARQAQPKPE